MHREETHSVLLKSLRSAGYQWSATVADPHIVRVEKVRVARSVGVNPPIGSLDEQFTLTACASGETTVYFRQARSFETAKAPHATYDVMVRVLAG